MPKRIATKPLTASAFSPFGDVIEHTGNPDLIINQGLCGRFHDRAKLQFAQHPDGRLGVSLFDAKPRSLPYKLDMVERHPLGSQCFIPMTENPFLVVVATDRNGTPDLPIAFLSSPGQCINFHINIWHGVLTPLSAPGHFAVIDRIGEGPNLEEFWFEKPYEIFRDDKAQ